MAFNSKWLADQRGGGSRRKSNDGENLFAKSWAFYFGGSPPSGASSGSSIELAPLDGAGAATSDAVVDQARAEEQAAMSYGDRFKGFAMLIVASACFFGLALFFLPTAVLFPGKFALSFTLGSVFFMASFAFLRGPVAHLTGMVSRERLPFSVAYVTSLCLTMYSCIVAKSYIMTLGSAIFQIAALMWYGASFLPGGRYGMKIFSMMFLKTVKNMAGPCWNAVTGMCKCCFRQSSLLPT